MGQELAREDAVLVLFAIEAMPEAARLPAGGFTDADGHIDASGADEGGIEAVDVVGGKEEDTLFGAGDAVEGVKEAGEGDGCAAVAIGIGLGPAVVEGGVGVFEEDEGPFGDYG